MRKENSGHGLKVFVLLSLSLRPVTVCSAVMNILRVGCVICAAVKLNVNTCYVLSKKGKHEPNVCLRYKSVFSLN